MEKNEVKNPPRMVGLVVDTTGNATVNHLKYPVRKAKLQEMISNHFNFIVDVDFKIMDMQHATYARPNNEYVIVSSKSNSAQGVQRKNTLSEFLKDFKQQESHHARYSKTSFYVQITTLCNEDMDVNDMPDVKYAAPEKSAFAKNYEMLCLAHKTLPLYGAPLSDQPDIEGGFAYFHYFDEACMIKATTFFSSCDIESGVMVPQTTSRRNVLMFMLDIKEEMSDNLKLKKEEFDITHDEKIILDHIYWILHSYLGIPNYNIKKAEHRNSGVSSLYKVECKDTAVKTSVEDAFKLYKIAHIPHGNGGHKHHFNFFVPMSKNALEIYNDKPNIAMAEFTALLKVRNQVVDSADTTASSAHTPVVLKAVSFEERCEDFKKFLSAANIKIGTQIFGNFYTSEKHQYLSFYPMGNYRNEIIEVFKNYKIDSCVLNVNANIKSIKVDVTNFVNPLSGNEVQISTPAAVSVSLKNTKKVTNKSLKELKAKILGLFKESKFTWGVDYQNIQIIAKKRCTLNCSTNESVKEIFTFLKESGISVVFPDITKKTLYAYPYELHQPVVAEVKVQPIVLKTPAPAVVCGVEEGVKQILREAKTKLMQVIAKNAPEEKTVTVLPSTEELADLFLTKFSKVGTLSIVTMEGVKVSTEPVTKELIIKVLSVE